MSSAEIDALWSIDDPVSGYVRLHQALESHPECADELQTQICRSLGLLSKFDEGWKELAKVSSHPSPIVQVRVLLESGRLKNSSGDEPDAVPFFERALDLATKGRFDYYAVDAAHMLAIATRGDVSIAWNERALSMASRSIDARARRWKGSLLNNLGWTYHDLGDYDQALAKFKDAEALQAESGDPVSIRISKWTVARCYRSMKRYGEALKIQEDLIKYPELGYVSEELAENLLATGRREEAQAHFNRAFELLSKDQYLKEHAPGRLQRLKDLGQSQT